MVETFEIVPATGKGPLLLWPIAVLVLLVGLVVPLLLRSSLHASRNARFDLSSEGLRLHGEVLWRSWVPAAELRGHAARVVDLDTETTLALAARTAGTGLPGYAAGWHRLNDGQKALVYVTRRQGVVYVPTTSGFSVLLSVTEPERMVARLREIAPRS